MKTNSNENILIAVINNVTTAKSNVAIWSQLRKIILIYFGNIAQANQVILL